MSKKKKKEQQASSGTDREKTANQETANTSNESSSGNDLKNPESAPQEDMQSEIDALKDRLMRLQADFDNYRKRMIREKEETFQMANEALMEEILPVLDHIEMALNAAEQQQVPSAFLDGINLVMGQLMQVLQKFGLSPINADGLEFDPHKHEAISHLKSETVPDHHIIAQTRRGYCLRNKVLRAAQVVVSDGIQEPFKQTANDEPELQEDNGQ